MAIYFASFDMKAMAHDYSGLLRHLSQIGAHRAQSSAWLIDSDREVKVLSDCLLGFLDRGDSLFLLEVQSTTPWAATRLAPGTGEWLKQRRP
ncbi:hypothetical protein [Methylobacterium nigriterrae]|uniref:hypothetical protein n=1 Tax=Methylobacterium nigriterrae TaxID=3127512 RepID=UPI0030139206